jgi:hypothetical protein
MCGKQPIKYGGSRLCGNCYQWQYHKQKKTVTGMMRYLEKVDLTYNRSQQYTGGARGRKKAGK